ncbi:MAG: hypothetical protein ACJZ02_06505 [Candidatus Neomarinimicrobiota bacterium]
MLFTKESAVRYFRSEKTFISDSDISIKDLRFRNYIEVRYDTSGIITKKSYFKIGNRLDRFEVFEYDNMGEISVKSLFTKDSTLRKITRYGINDAPSEKFIRYTYGLSKVRDYDDRFTSVEYNDTGQVQVYRFYDVNGFMYGVIELQYNDENMVRQEDWILMPSRKVVRRYVKNYDERTGETDIWEYDSTLTVVNSMTLNSEGRAPIITIEYPADSIPINTSNLSYYLKEDLASGLIKWDWIGGKRDSLGPYFSNLVSSERSRGRHKEKKLRNPPVLQDSSIYQITFSGIGESGYPAEDIILSTVTFDITPPNYTIDAPAFTNVPRISYNPNEALSSAEIVWVWERGKKDETSPHVIGLSEGMLQSGQKDSVIFREDVQLIDGTTYSVLFQGKDMAGNKGPFLSVNSVLYDTTRPEFTWDSPDSGGYANSSVISYISSEDLSNAQIKWIQANIDEDEAEPYIIDLAGSELDGGEHLYEALSKKPELINGGLYTIIMTGEDLAGNTANPVIINNIIFDTTPPSLLAIAPEPGISIRSGEVIYTLDEDFSSAEIDWILENVDGKDERNIKIQLTDEGLKSGDHRLADSTFIEKLTDGGTFTIRLTGRDKAGNEALPSSIENIKFDVTAPEFVDVTPGDCTFVMTSAVTYTLTENLSEASIIWTQVGGEPDFASPQIMDIPFDHLTEGFHDSVMANQQLVLQDGSIYVISFMGVDAAGNRSLGASSTDVMYDITPPEINLSFPVNGSHVPTTVISYNSSERLKTGAVIWEWIDGKLDVRAPHTITMNGNELSKGNHNFIDMNQSPNLVSGGIYRVTIEGKDLSGKASDPITAMRVTFDDTPPELSITSPEMASHRNAPAIGYELSESLSSASVVWDRKDGAEDPTSPHILSLESFELSGGFHPDSLPANIPFLKDGAIYDLYMVGVDSAGNISDTVFVSDINYDITPPVLEVNYPITSIPTRNIEVSYSLSENLKSGEIIWTSIDSTTGDMKQFIQVMSESELVEGFHERLAIKNSPPALIEGIIYSVAFNGMDLAGNKSEPVIVADVMFDATKPIFAEVRPDSGGFINNSNLTYNLSESIALGSALWESKSPELDSIIIHTADFEGEELAIGLHEKISLLNSPQLVNGAIYTFKVAGEDAAGNKSDTIIVDNITFDADPPIIELLFPSERSFISTSNLSYSFSEELSLANANWEWLEGTRDTAEIHNVQLVNDELLEGDHIDTKFFDAPNLAEGGVYRLTLSGLDRAGNEAIPIILENLTFDATAPLFDDFTPILSSYINGPLIGYWLSENLKEGKLTWEHIGGTSDEKAPHITNFVGSELNAGTRAPGLMAETPLLVDGAIYSLKILGLDPAGNISDTLRIDSVYFDITDPQITVLYPDTNSFVNTAEIKYSLSENILEGTITYQRIGGNADLRSPHIIKIDEESLVSFGLHDSLDPSILPQLQDGSLYRITYAGIDRAGNEAIPITVENVSYDITAPIISNLAPLDSIAVNHTRFSYNLNEAMVEGSIRWTNYGGAEDSKSPHTISLFPEMMSIGNSGEINLETPPPLIDGGEYLIEIFGSDIAGNNADTVKISSITYDITPPEYLVTYPSTDIYVPDSRLSFSLSESLSTGVISWIHTGGSADPRSPHEISLSNEELLSKPFDGYLMNQPTLVDGASYRITFNGEDPAGNQVDEVFLKDVKVDFSPPIITVSSPLSGAAIKEPIISYSISEDLKDGTMFWTQIEGVADPASPHMVPLDSDELLSGDHPDVNLIFPPLLSDGSIYNFAFVGIDYAGNQSDTLIIESLRYDVTEPIITVNSPVDGDYLNEILPSFSFSEDMLEATITWTQIGGVEDVNTPHESVLTGNELLSGDHVKTALLNLPALVDGAIYSVLFSGLDLAGNYAQEVFIDKVTYDITSPVIAISSPESNIFIDKPMVSFSLSEDLASGEFLWRDLRSSANNLSIKLSSSLKVAGDYPEIDLSDSLSLLDGSAYSILMTGEDLAGNKAEPVSIENVGYDTSPPTLTIDYPNEGDYVNSNVISYNLSEPLKEGKLTWVRTGGVEDPSQPRIINLSNSMLTSGSHPELLSEDINPLVAGSMYTLTLEGIDMAGNAGENFTVTNISFDNIAPNIIANYPQTDQFVNTKEVDYSLSELFKRGQISWIRTGGSADPYSPHEITLNESELNDGDHPQSITSNVPNLVDGSIYSIVFSGVDMAGNASEEVTIPGVTYDVSAPLFTLEWPESMKAINGSEISYSLSEKMQKASLVWKHVAGVADPSSPHTVELLGDEMLNGSFEKVGLTMEPTLVDGGIYDISTIGNDLAGNNLTSSTIQQVLFDVTPPSIIASFPAPTSFVRTSAISYNLSETLSEGKVVWERTGGEIDASSPHEVRLSGLELSMGEHNEIVLTNAPNLVSGSVYSISFEGIDPATNNASGMTIESVTFDNVPPLLTIKTSNDLLAINEPRLTYSISENSISGIVTFEQTSGNTDPNSPHEVVLVESELSKGEHAGAIFSNSPTLVNGGIYRISFTATDAAGNEAETVRINGILFDSIKPLITLNSPELPLNTKILDIDYTLSEELSSATATWTRTGGKEDSESPRVIELSVPEKGEGNRKGTLSNQIPLVDGGIYTLTINGSDAAGNKADEVSVAGIKYDISPPMFSAINPTEGYTNGKTFSYNIDETIVSGNIIFKNAPNNTTRDGGAPHTVILSGQELKKGPHNSIDLSDPPTLVSGASYSVAFSGTDSSGNTSDPVNIGPLMFDNTSPVVIVTGPSSGSSVNNPSVSYELSETLLSGKITWKSNTGSSQEKSLSGNELIGGLHESITLTDSPSLSDGSTYTLEFSGVDNAGNSMDPVTISDVTFDVTPPRFSLDFSNSAPGRGLFNHNYPIGMTFSEDMGEVIFRWEREGGSEDPDSPHYLNVAEEDLGSGDHPSILVPGSENILIGTSYTLTVAVKDKAGNAGKSQTVENIDIVRPLDGDWAYQGIAVILWSFNDGKFTQGVLFGNTLGDEKPGEYAIDWSKRPFRMAIKYDDGTRRYGLFEFIGHNRLRVVSSSEKRPSSWSDGDYFEFDYREKNIP